MPVNRIVYLDHSASTPTDPRVMAAMMPYFTEIYGNASSAHRFGRQAEAAIEAARETVARTLNAKPSEIVFTSGGSESDNLALRGVAWWARQYNKGNHLITMPIEHSAVSKTMAQMASVMEFEQTILPVDHNGLVDVEDLGEALRPDTALATIMYANNEIGTVEPLPVLAACAHNRGTLFHTDAVQAAGQLPLDVEALGVDMLSISAHKFYGPKGVGALYVRDGVELIPSQSGGSHEEGRRAGTSNTPFIVGLAKALEIAYAELDENNAHYRAMRDRLIEGILRRVPDSLLSGHPEQRLPAHASFVFDGVDSSLLVMHLDMKGVAASGGSACKTGNPEPSGVLMAMGYNEQEAIGGLRLTVGRQTSEADIEYAVDTVVDCVETVRKLRREMTS